MIASRRPETAVINALCDELLTWKRLPQYCDLSKIGPLHAATVYSGELRDEVISSDVQCGMDLDRDVAILKSLVECVERAAIKEGVQRGDPLCFDQGSDGFAAFPSFGIGSAAAGTRARANALREATERFVWSTWWDHPEVASTITNCEDVQLSRTAHAVLRAIGELIPIRTGWLVRPEVRSSIGHVVIFYLRLNTGGVISGGACDSSEDEAILRALGELARHAVAARRLQNGARARTFYERRMAHMISPSAGFQLMNRLSSDSREVLTLPPLELDQALDHPAAGAVVVHRCLFAGQPDFVAGPVERLCL